MFTDNAVLKIKYIFLNQFNKYFFNCSKYFEPKGTMYIQFFSIFRLSKCLAPATFVACNIQCNFLKEKNTVYWWIVINPQLALKVTSVFGMLTKSMLFQVFSNNRSFVQQTRYFLLKIIVVHLFQTYVPANRESFYIHNSLLGPTVWIGHRRRVVQGIIESTGCCCLHQTQDRTRRIFMSLGCWLLKQASKLCVVERNAAECMHRIDRQIT